MKKIAKWLLPFVVDALVELAKEHVNDPETEADDKWYDHTKIFLKALGAKKLG